MASRIGAFGVQAAGRLVRMPPVPDIPEGRMVELPGRGHTYVVDTGTAPSATGGEAPTLLLLHALACTGLLTWYPCLDALRRRYRVVIFDQRWHGQGIRSTPFRIEDCADDVAAVADALDIDTFISAGYSMGTLVSQLTWRRHPDRVAGLVLCAGATHFATTPRRQEAVRLASLRLATMAAKQSRIAVDGLDPGIDERWAWRQFRATTGREILAASSIIAQFDSRRWIERIDAPTSVVVTARDRLIPPARQRAMARSISGATVYDVDAGHAACVLNSERFRPAMLAATASVSTRILDRPSRAPH
jgi:diacylglycerol O-acyltransferase